jgi:hypothetical protein
MKVATKAPVTAPSKKESVARELLGSSIKELKKWTPIRDSGIRSMTKDNPQSTAMARWR